MKEIIPRRLSIDTIATNIFLWVMLPNWPTSTQQRSWQPNYIITNVARYQIQKKRNDVKEILKSNLNSYLCFACFAFFLIYFCILWIAMFCYSQQHLLLTHMSYTFYDAIMHKWSMNRIRGQPGGQFYARRGSGCQNQSAF